MLDLSVSRLSRLPDAGEVLDHEGDRGDGEPAGGALEDGAPSGSDECAHVGGNADCGHGGDDEELAGAGEKGGQFGGQGDEGVYNSGGQEAKDEPGEDADKGEGAGGWPAVGALCAAGLSGGCEGKDERDRDDQEGARQFDDGGEFEGVVGAGGVAPGGGCGDYRGSVVDGGAGPDAEAFVAQGEETAEGREEDDGDDVEQEYGRNRLRNVLVFRVDDGSGGGDCRASADAGADADQDCSFFADAEQAVEERCCQEGNRNGEGHDQERAAPDRKDPADAHFEAEQDNRVLQDFLRGELDAGERCGGAEKASRDEAERDGEYGSANYGYEPAQEPCRNGDCEGVEEAGNQ